MTAEFPESDEPTAPLPHLTMPRILFYAVNGLGLGHVTRLLAIARAVRARCPEAQVLFVTTSEADWVIYREGFAAVKVPSRSILPAAKLRPAVYAKLVHSVVLNVVSAFNPAILVADTFPAGASQELLATLSWEMRRAFVFRAQKPERAVDPFFQSALGRYDICIAPHEEGEEQIPIPEPVKPVWTGPILVRDATDALSRCEARTRLGLPANARIAYVTFGGGGDAEADEAAAIAIAGAKRAGWSVAVADAPLSRSEPGHDAGVFHVAHYPMAEMLAAFDAAISAGGYNSVGELMHFGVPSILIPFERGLDDQFARVDRMAAAGGALTCPLDAAAIATALGKVADPAVAWRMSASARSLVPANGAQTAADAILALL
jgi:predicted glycosyltransferase